MDVPQLHADSELKNIIDKLAQFVARNGPEFEQMTRNKQKNNPKFSFLFGGELFNYYQYRVTSEQAILKSKAGEDSTNLASQPQVLGSHSGGYNVSPQVPQPPMTPLQIMNAAAANTTHWMANQPQSIPPLNVSGGTLPVGAIIEQQNVLQQQITQSEQNLAAQHSALLQAQDTLILDAIRKSMLESLRLRAQDHGVSLTEMDSTLQPIIESCTKDSISSGKAWILNHTSPDAQDVISQYLLHKVTAPDAPFSQKLHLIYLINDVMHHCVRKNALDLKKSLESVVVPMVCSSWIEATSDQQDKLKKLLNLWEAKNNYFSKEIIAQLKTPEQSWSQYQVDLLQANEAVAAPLKRSTKATYEGYRAQHEVFVNHALTQLQTLEQQKIQIEQQQQQELQNIQFPPPAPIISDENNMSYDSPQVPLSQPPMESFSVPPPAALFGHLPPELLPDFSKPPPGFQPEPALDLDLIPSVPYYELPAGLMVPLIRIDDFNYKSLDPGKLRLPPAVPPSERLMQAVEAFYQKTYAGAGNTRERLILDADGWEKLGLYEYYKAKNAARKNKELEIENGGREKSRSPSPIVREKSRSKSPKRRRFRSRSPSPKGKSKSRSRSKSRSPPQRQYRSSNGRRSPKRSQNSSPRKSLPARRRSKSKSRSRSPSPPPRARSPTPPSFLGATYGKTPEEKLDESNIGHQMLRKMGWGGAGLGSKEQGIEAPISGGDIRDRVDQYKGVGVSLHDPFENFRKSKGQAFITRMKARAEERSST